MIPIFIQLFFYCTGTVFLESMNRMLIMSTFVSHFFFSTKMKPVCFHSKVKKRKQTNKPLPLTLGIMVKLGLITAVTVTDQINFDNCQLRILAC